jgi:hypothetical protein
MSWSLFAMPLVARPGESDWLAEAGIEVPSEMGRLPSGSEVRDAIVAAGAEGKFWREPRNWFFFTAVDSPVQIGEVDAHPLPWSGDWSAAVDCVSFRKPQGLLDALDVSRRLARLTGGPWVVFLDYAPEPVLLAADSDLANIASSLGF